MNKKIKNKNILYTGFGDNGKTTLFNCNQQKISKSASIIEALGALDEINAFLGIVKISSQIEQLKIPINNKKILLSKIIEEIQQILFIIQAETGGSKIKVGKKEVKKIENIIQKISVILPPIRSFTISGGSLISAELDYARTLARRAERRIITVLEDGSRDVGIQTISYLNRLSSLLFALSRITNYLLSIEEKHPKYNKKY